MSKHTTPRRIRRAPKPLFAAPTLADALLRGGQRLRATESATATTFALTYAARWQQAQAARTGGAR